MTDSVPVSDVNWAGQESEDTGSKAQEQTRSSSNVTSFPTFLYRRPLQENKNVENQLCQKHIKSFFLLYVSIFQELHYFICLLEMSSPTEFS